MNNFQLITDSTSQVVAIGLDYGYPSITEIEKSLNDQKFSGTLYIDALLCNGTADNRFASGTVVNGVIDRTSIRIMKPSMEVVCLKAIATKFFKNNQQYVDSNLILTDSQKQQLLS